MVEQNLSAKEGKQGWRDYQVVLSVILLNLCGGDCVDDIKGLERDAGLQRVFKHLDLKNAFGRGRQKLIRQWRNGKINTFPSPSSMFRYLKMFHNLSEEEHRLEKTAFIPLSNEHLLGLKGINKDMLEFLQLNKPEKRLKLTWMRR